jgi:hypothetical protein
MLTYPPAQFRKRRGRLKQAAPPAPPAAALVLVEASFDEGGPSLRLGFDRAIDIDGLVGAQIVVEAGNVTGTRYEALGTATMDGTSAVIIGLLEIGPSISEDTVLSAGAGNGIVAIDDGGLWSGASELVLPYP